MKDKRIRRRLRRKNVIEWKKGRIRILGLGKTGGGPYLSEEKRDSPTSKKNCHLETRSDF